MLDVLTEESHKRSNSNKVVAGLRQKAKSKDTPSAELTLLALHTKKNEAIQVKAGRLTAPGFWSPYKQKETGNVSFFSYFKLSRK